MTIIFTGAVCSLAICTCLNRICDKINEITKQNNDFWQEHMKSKKSAPMNDNPE